MVFNVVPAGSAAAERLLCKEYGDLVCYEQAVREILHEVRCRGDAAVLAFTARFDGVELTADTLRVTAAEIDEAYSQVDAEFLAALRLARANIQSFHQKQLPKSWLEPDSRGNALGQLVRPLDRVGIYVPGGTADYPSSVLMNAVPAQVAGVREIVMVAPPRQDGRLSPYTLVAAREAGVTEIYKVGGAQAIAALAYGTETIGKVDLITGPGNIYVTLAKKEVYGQVNIDMLAGPSEVLIIADETANPRYLAADLLSQAEHDVLASALLLTPSRELAEAVASEVEIQLQQLERKEIAARSLQAYGGAIITANLEEAVTLANRYAPEHLELQVADPWQWLGRIRHAGAIFLGAYTPEPVGDYLAGPNHVLPTGGTARFYSALNVETFMKKTSLLSYSAAGLLTEGQAIVKLAQTEGLTAHARAVAVRLEDLAKEEDH